MITSLLGGFAPEMTPVSFAFDGQQLVFTGFLLQYNSVSFAFSKSGEFSLPLTSWISSISPETVKGSILIFFLKEFSKLSSTSPSSRFSLFTWVIGASLPMKFFLGEYLFLILVWLTLLFLIAWLTFVAVSLAMLELTKFYVLNAIFLMNFELLL